MKKAGIILLITGIFFLSAFSQEKTLLTIGNKNVSADEFERIYLKNNQQTPTEQDLKDYLDLFINFKLKVLEAENLGYDTSASFKNEYNKYIKQLAEPYFIDKDLEDKMIKEAYERSKKEVRVSYIMIQSEPYDTTEAYEKAMNIYKRLVNGEDFSKVAVETSDAPNVKTDKGDAWFNKVFMMPYKLENFAFTHKIGDISKPLYANKAFFILKITGERQAPQKVRVEHIYVRLPQNPTLQDSTKAMALLDSIKKDLDAGVPFENVAQRYSQDTYSAQKGGDLGWFSTGKMIRNFENAVYSIKNIGDVIGPVRTAVGYHYIKLIDKKEPKSLDDNRDFVKSKLSKDNRAHQSYYAVLNRLKKEYNYKEYINNIKPIIKYYDSESLKPYMLTDSIIDTFTGKLMIIGDSTYKVKDFMYFLQKGKNDYKRKNPAPFIYRKFKEYSEKMLFNYEKARLPEKYPEFKYLVKEYHDGILLFDLTDKMVWSKAVKDTAGLKKFYEQNKNKYMWGERIHAYIYTVPEKYAKKAKKIAAKSENLTIKQITENLYKLAKKDTTAKFLVENKKLSKGENKTIDNANISKGIVELENKDGIVKFAYIIEKLPPMPKKLSEVRGLMTADYQNYLEKEWIKELRKKYKVEINEKVLKSIK